jgi:hypothetical protein
VKYPKVLLVTDCRTHLVLAAVPGRGPASDLVLFKAAIKDAAGRARIGTLLADADFDGEWVHEHVRGVYGIRTLIPPMRGRPSEKPLAGKWRRWMKAQLGRFKAKYGQRWQTETVNSMVKRRLGSALRARGYWSQGREIILRVITHNVIVWPSGSLDGDLMVLTPPPTRYRRGLSAPGSASGGRGGGSAIARCRSA